MLQRSSEPQSARLYTSHERLLRCKAQGLAASRLKVVRPHSIQAGVNRSARLGRGTEFIELRPYSPGDDIRHMDWRATARSDASWIRAFESDLNFAVTLVVDQRTALFFGSERYTKTLLSAELAAIAAWDHLHLGYAVQFIFVEDHGLRASDACRTERELERELAFLTRIQNQGKAFQKEEVAHSSQALLDYLVSYGSHRDVFFFSTLAAPSLLDEKQLAAVADHHALKWINISDRLDSDLLNLRGIHIADRNGSLSLDDLGVSALTGYRQAVLEQERDFATSCKHTATLCYEVSSGTSALDAYSANRGFGRFEGEY